MTKRKKMPKQDRATEKKVGSNATRSAESSGPVPLTVQAMGAQSKRSTSRLKKIFKGRSTKKKSSSGTWLLYGAYGFVGRLIIEKALESGQRPILSGRSIIKLRPLAEQYGLPWRIVDLEQPHHLKGLLTDIDLVCNVSGPFVNTARTLIEACIETQTHYIDISSELPSVQMSLSYDEQARDAGIAVIPACGITAIPTDCMVKHLVDRVGPLKSVQVALDVPGTKSAGTLASVLEVAAFGGRVRRDHRLLEEPIGRRVKMFKFSHATKSVISLPLVDLTTIYWWSRIPNITTFMAQSIPAVTLIKLLEPVNRWVLSASKIRHVIEAELNKHMPGPSNSDRARGRTHVWVRALAHDGKQYEAGLETLESYSFTAEAIPKVVEHVFKSIDDGIEWGGVYTPAQAFGADFVTQIPSTLRFGMLEPLEGRASDTADAQTFELGKPTSTQASSVNPSSSSRGDDFNAEVS